MVELSDDEMEEGVGGPGIGYVNPNDNQVQPPPEAPGFPSHDSRLRIDQLGMERQREQLRARREAGLGVPRRRANHSIPPSMYPSRPYRPARNQNM